MSARRFALIVALALLVMVFAGNVIFSRLGQGLRLDLTENQLYTLSPGAKQTLDELAEPLVLTFFYSREAASEYEELSAYAARVREQLQFFAARSRGMIELKEVDPIRFTEEEDQAVAAGIQPLNPERGADPIYFGLVGANAVDEKVTIPVFSPQREQFLEYEITRLITELEAPRRGKVAVISSLPLDPMLGFNPMTGAVEPPLGIIAELQRGHEVEFLPADFVGIPDDVGVLAILHPRQLNDAQLYAIDQFILKKGRAFIAVDPASPVIAQRGAGQMGGGAPQASSLARLLNAWGVSVSADVVLDLEGAISLGPQAPPQPLFIQVTADRLNKDDLSTASLTRAINFVAAGAITSANTPGVTVTPLARTTPNTMRLSADQALMMPQPEQLLATWQPTGKQEVIAARISGALQSAFPNTQGALASSATPAEIILVADADMLDDRLYVQEGGAPVRDNGSFVVNAIDLLGGSPALVSLRSRAESLRPLTVIEEMRAQAEQDVFAKEEALKTEVADTERRLQELQAKGAGSGLLTGAPGAELSPAEAEELERFRNRLVELRQELRGVERTFRVDIDRLQGWLMFLNVWLPPLLVAGLGLFVFWRRQRRANAAAPPTQTAERAAA
jgi:ABC-type uncharacterized transport system involved in gliding motility auxiliary subunit